jgi:hypothetical protein
MLLMRTDNTSQPSNVIVRASRGDDLAPANEERKREGKAQRAITD